MFCKYFVSLNTDSSALFSLLRIMWLPSITTRDSLCLILLNRWRLTNFKYYFITRCQFIAELYVLDVKFFYVSATKQIPLVIGGLTYIQKWVLAVKFIGGSVTQKCGKYFDAFLNVSVLQVSVRLFSTWCSGFKGVYFTHCQIKYTVKGKVLYRP